MANTYNICTKLQSIADALGDAQTSDLIDALADIAQAISQGGGGGTSDYTQLTNKPQINGYVLSGNQTSSQLGLQSALTFDNTPTSGSSNPVTSDGVYDAIDTLNSNFSSKLQYISGKCASGFSSYVPLPTGYTINNCIILTIMVDEPGDGTMWRSGAGMGGASTRLFAEMSSNGVRVYNDFSTYIGHDFYVVLMKM